MGDTPTRSALSDGIRAPEWLPQLPRGWKEAATNLGQLVARNLLQLAIGIGASAAIAGSLSRGDYGVLQYVFSVASTFTILSIPGFNTVLTQEVAQGNDGVLRGVTRTRFLWSWLISAVLLAAATYYWIVSPRIPVAIGLALAALASPFVAAIDVTGFLTAKRDYRRLALYPLVSQSCVAAATIAVAAYLHDVVLVIASTYAVQIAYALWSYGSVLRIWAPASRELAADARVFAWKLTLANAIPSVAYRLDMLIVGSFVGLEQLAVLALGRLFYDKMRIVMEPMAALFVPRLYVRKGAEAYVFALQALVVMMVIFGAIAAVLAIAMPMVFSVLYAGYMDSVPYAIALLFAYVVSVPNAVFQTVLQYERRARQVASSTFISNAVYLICLPILTLNLGLWGVVIARYLLNTGGWLLSGYYLQKNWRGMSRHATE